MEATGISSRTAVCTARIPVELKIDFSTRGAVHYVRPCSNSPPAVVASSTSSNKSSGGHRHKRSSATPTKDTHQHQHTTNNSNTNSTQQNKVKASTAPHTRISNRTNMATLHPNTNANTNASANANTNAYSYTASSDNFSFWESRGLMAVAPGGGFLSGLLRPNIAKAEPAIPPAHELEPAVVPLKQSPSMVRRSAMMAMGVYSHALPEVRTMGAEATESRGLLDRQLREHHGTSHGTSPPAKLSFSTSSWMDGMDGLSGLYTGMANQSWR